MSPFALLSLFRGRGSLATVFGLVLLSTLWVTSLTVISSRPNATELLTDTGAQVLNPFLVNQGFGITEQYYTKTLQPAAKAHPTQALSLPLLKVSVLGSAIVNKPYADGVRVIYGQVADTYYTDGLGGVFNIPTQLKDILPYFGLFDPNNLPITPGGTTPTTLPTFLQPFFTVVGLTPDTFTATGNQRLWGLLPWFWLATLVFGALTIIFNRGQLKLSALAHGIIHSTWPVVGMLLALWVAANWIPQTAATLHSYTGVLGVVMRSFLPIYGSALVLGVATLYVPRFVAARRGVSAGEPAMAHVGARASSSAGSAGGSSAFSAPFSAEAAPAPFDSFQSPGDSAPDGGEGQ
jgi:hypothetical protein